MHRNNTIPSLQRKTFTSMAATYCLGVFNDNYFKQAAMLLAVAGGLNQLQGWAAVLFSLPFILFAAPGGWCADRFSKKRMIVFSKALEVAAMVIGGAGMLLGNWPCILGMVFLMGLQSTFFGPALNGSIPEVFPSGSVPGINARLKLGTTVAILLGIAAAGFCLDRPGSAADGAISGTAIVAVVAVLSAIAGFVASLAIGHPAVRNADKPFPWLGPVNSVKDLVELGGDRQLLLAVVANTWFYFVASAAVLVINTLGLQQFGFSQSITSLLPVTLMVGVCAGSLLAAKWVRMEDWSSHLVVAGCTMGAALLLVGFTPMIVPGLQMGWLCLTLLLSGLGGGLFLIPITSILQVRPAAEDKGKVLAAAGFSSFCAILVSGLLYNLVEPQLPTALMAGLGGATVLVTILLGRGVADGGKKKRVAGFLGWLLRRLVALRYRVKVNGLDEIAKNGTDRILFLPNHPALIDPVILMSQLIGPFGPRPLAKREQIDRPVVRTLVAPVRPIAISDRKQSGTAVKKQVEGAIDEVVNRLREGDNVLFYPAGRLCRNGLEDLGSNSGVESILGRVPDVRVVKVRTTGLWGSSFSFGGGERPSLFARLNLYLRSLLVNGLFFSPRRQVEIEFVEDDTISTLKTRQELNRSLESWYNETARPNTKVAYFWWQGRQPQILPEPVQKTETFDVAEIPQSIREEVELKIGELAGIPVQPQQRLAGDLGLDSLTIMDLGVWLEQEFGVSIPNLEALETVGDCLSAATGIFLAAGSETRVKVPEDWFRPLAAGSGEIVGQTITELFLRQARSNPSSLVIADSVSGFKSYRQIVMAIFALRPVIAQIEGERVGIMLPGSTTAAILYLATLFAGKTPVLFNWTAGIANLRHGIEDTGVTTILSAEPLCRRIEEQQGVQLSALPVDWLQVDGVVKGLTWYEKIGAFLQSVLGVSRLEKMEVPETAAILFTSGSESRPKPVPLSHTNILTNLRDFSSLVDIGGDNRLMGILPPFHSLGLAGTIIMPLCMGLKTVYHANPTESAQLAGLIGAYRATMLITTPTFLSGILQAADDRQLDSLTTIFTGAEKCPHQVLENLKRHNPGAELCEGYGITECSPLVAINTPDNSRPGTIGRVLPSIEYAIVDEKKSSRVAPGRQGMLLVRGPSIFSGYLNDATGKGFCRFENTSWYETGDYVREEKDGSLTFCGRGKRFIKIGGEMISLPAIESTLLAGLNRQDGVAVSLAVEASEDEGHPEIVLFTTEALKRQQVNDILRKAGLSGLHNVRRLMHVEEIPVLGTGKTDYRRLKGLLG